MVSELDCTTCSTRKSSTGSRRSLSTTRAWTTGARSSRRPMAAARAAEARPVSRSRAELRRVGQGPGRAHEQGDAGLADG